MASLAPSDQQTTLMNNFSQLTMTENPENNDHVTKSGFDFGAAAFGGGAAATAASPSFGGAAFGGGAAAAAASPSFGGAAFGGGDAPPTFGGGASDGAAPSFGFGGGDAPPPTSFSGAAASGAAPAFGFGGGNAESKDESGAYSLSGAQAATGGFSMGPTFSASRRRQTKTPQRRSPKKADTDYAAVQIKLNTVKEKLKNAATAKDYVAAGELQSQQKRLEEQFKTVYQAHQQNLKDKLQQRRSNGSPSIMPAQEMEQIRIKVWADYIQRTFTPNLQLAVDQLLDIVQRRMTVAATKGLHFVDVCNYDQALRTFPASTLKHGASREELKIMHTVMTSRVAFSNFTWQLFRAGYQPSCKNEGAPGAGQWMVKIRMLRSFEKQAEQIQYSAQRNGNKIIMCYLEFAFVNYFERDCAIGTAGPYSGRQPVAGLPATDVVSKAYIQQQPDMIM